MGYHLNQLLGFETQKIAGLKSKFWQKKSLCNPFLLLTTIYSLISLVHLRNLAIHFVPFWVTNPIDSIGSGGFALPDDPTSAFWLCSRPIVTDGSQIHPNKDSKSEISDFPSSPLYSTNSFLNLQYTYEVYTISSNWWMCIYMYYLTMCLITFFWIVWCLI